MRRQDSGRLCRYCASPMQGQDSFCPECGRLQTVMPPAAAVPGPELEGDSPVRPAPPVQTPVEPEPQWFVDLSNAPLAPLDYKFPEPPDDDPTLPDPLARTRRFAAARPEEVAVAAVTTPEEPPHLVYPGRLFAHPLPEGSDSAAGEPAVRRELPAPPEATWQQAKRIVALALALLSLLLLVLAGIMIYRALVKFPAPSLAPAPGRPPQLAAADGAVSGELCS